MDNLLKGSRAFIKILDGNVITSELYSTEILVQRLKKDTDVPMPDWENSQDQPIIYPRILSQSSGKRVSIESFKWFYNGKEIGKNNPTFDMVEYIDGGLYIPGLKIIRNLASLTNLDTDTISFEAITRVGGIPYDIKCSIDIRIEEVVGEAYDGIIRATESGVIDDNTPQVTCTAVLYKGGQEITKDVTYEWYKITTNGTEKLIPNSGTPNKYTFKEGDIDSELSIYVNMFYKGQKVYVARRTLSDESDALYLHLALSNSTTLKEGESCTIVPTVYNRILDKVVTGYNFTFKFLDDNLELIESFSGIPSYKLESDFLKKHNGSVNLLVYTY